ncbi:MAG: ATP-binding protein [Planctomycetota bacterium]|nr:ATP-binding protein [Planctomycetota bacterium]
MTIPEKVKSSCWTPQRDNDTYRFVTTGVTACPFPTTLVEKLLQMSSNTRANPAKPGDTSIGRVAEIGFGVPEDADLRLDTAILFDDDEEESGHPVIQSSTLHANPFKQFQEPKQPRPVTTKIEDPAPAVTSNILKQVMKEQDLFREESQLRKNPVVNSRMKSSATPAPRDLTQQSGKTKLRQDATNEEISRFNVNLLKELLSEGITLDKPSGKGMRLSEIEDPSLTSELGTDLGGFDSQLAKLGLLETKGDDDGVPATTAFSAGPDAETVESVLRTKKIGDQTFVNKIKLDGENLIDALKALEQAAKLANETENIENVEPVRVPATAGIQDLAQAEDLTGKAASQGGKSRVFRFNPELADLEEQMVKSESTRSSLHKARPKQSSIMFSVERKGSFSRVVSYHFKRAGWKLQIGEGADKTLQLVSPDRLSLLLADTTIKGFFELLMELKINKSTNHIPIIAVSPAEMEMEDQHDLMVLPDEELVEPFEIGTLLKQADWELARATKAGISFDQRVHMILPTRLDKLDQAKAVMERLLLQSGLDKKSQISLIAGFYEALGNAARHGNKNRPATWIEILYLLDAEKITIAIKDEGDGFDITPFCSHHGTVDKVHILKERLEREDIGTMGVPMLSQVADLVQFNASGNMVTLTKYLNGKPASAEAKTNRAAVKTAEAKRDVFEDKPRIPAPAEALNPEAPLEEEVPDFKHLANSSPRRSSKPATFEMQAVQQNWNKR